MSMFRSLGGIVASIAFVACSGTEPSQPTPSAASLRLINASGTTLNLTVDGQAVSQGIQTATVSATTGLTVGTHHLTISGGGVTPADLTVDAANGQVVTAAVTRGSSATSIAASVVADTGSIVPANKSKLKVMHLAQNAGAIEIWRTQPDYQTPVHIMTPFNYLDASPYLQSDPGVWEVFVTSAGSTTRLATTGPVNVPAGERRTVVLLDSAGYLRFSVLP